MLKIASFLNMKKYPLRRWMVLNEMTSGDLEKTSGVNASTIRHICRGQAASADKVKKLSSTTGIPPLVFFLPEENIDFDVSGCKANNIKKIVNC
jgi:hypothetical protein